MNLLILTVTLIVPALMGLMLAGYHRWVLLPALETQRLAMQASQERAGQQLQQYMEEQLQAVVANLPDSSLSGTTRQVLRFGSDLVEGGISSFLAGTPDHKAHSRSDRKPGKP